MSHANKWNEADTVQFESPAHTVTVDYDRQCAHQPAFGLHPRRLPFLTYIVRDGKRCPADSLACPLCGTPYRIISHALHHDQVMSRGEFTTLRERLRL